MVLVSSGAVAWGRKRLGLKQRPKEVAQLQAVAATGQSLLMRAYEDAFEAKGLHVAQVLLTHADLEDRARFLNTRSALQALFDLEVTPIVNENDTVATDELRFSDNDHLAVMVANLIEADAVLILSDVDGLLDAEQKLITEVDDIAPSANNGCIPIPMILAWGVWPKNYPPLREPLDVASLSLWRMLMQPR